MVPRSAEDGSSRRLLLEDAHREGPATRCGEPLTVRAGASPAVCQLVVVVVLVFWDRSCRSFAAPETHWLNGVPCWPATCFLLRSLQAVRGFFVDRKSVV